jgi:hypothetical protein
MTQRKTPVPVPLCPSQIPRGVSEDRIRTSEVRIPELAGHSLSLVAEVTVFFFKRATLHAVLVETVNC